MGKVNDLLYLGAEISTALVQRDGGKVLKDAKKIILDINGSKSIHKKLRSCFCPNAKEPKLALEYNISDQSNKVQMQFFDGKTPLSSGTLSRQNNGMSNFAVNITDSKGVNQVSANGSYNPNEKLFDWNNCGETLEHRFGYTSGRIDSSGFDISATVKDSCVTKILNEVKSFFKNDYKPIIKNT